jgi:hypothetical protein
MVTSTEPPLPNDVGQTDIPDSMSNNRVQEYIDITTNLRSVPASVANKMRAPQQGLSMSHSFTRADTIMEELDNFNRLGIQLPSEVGENDDNDWWNRSQQLVTHPISEPLSFKSDDCGLTNNEMKRRQKICSFKDSRAAW